jgi:hypothetical protein
MIEPILAAAHDRAHRFGPVYGTVMEEALQQSKCLPVPHFGLIMNAEEKSMVWFYEIRGSNGAVIASGKGFTTKMAAMAAGRKRARVLKTSGALQDGVGIIIAELAETLLTSPASSPIDVRPTPSK